MSETEKPKNLFTPKEQTAIVESQPVPAPVAEDQPTTLLQIISRATLDPRVDVEKMERLLAMHQTIVIEQRRTAFMAALATVAPQLKQIGKHGTSHHGKYARLEDIDRAIRPIISKEGFSLSFDTQPVGNNIRVICKLSHKEGHEEVKQLDLPIDTSGSKNGAQAVKSTVSYGRRILTQMFFNLIEEGEDTDGEIKAPLTAEQASALNNLIKTKGAPMHRFLKHMKVEKIEDILQRDYQHAFVTLRDWKSPVTSGQTK